MIHFSPIHEKYFKIMLAVVLVLSVTFWGDLSGELSVAAQRLGANLIMYCYMAYVIWDCRLFNIRFVVFAMLAGAVVLILSRWLLTAFFRVVLLDDYPGLEIIAQNVKEVLVYSLIAFAILGRNSLITWYRNKNIRFKLEYRLLTGVEHLILFCYAIIIFSDLADVLYFSYHQFVVGIQEQSASELYANHADWFKYQYLYNTVYAAQLLLLQGYHFEYFRKRWFKA